MRNFWLFQQAGCEVIAKYTNCNLLEHEWIWVGIKTLWGSNWGRNKNNEARQIVTGSYKKKCIFKSSHRNCSTKKVVVRKFINFIGKHLCWALQLYWKGTPTQVFSCEFCEIFKNTYFEEHLRTTASIFPL